MAGITLTAIAAAAGCSSSSGSAAAATPAADLKGRALVLKVADAIDKQSSVHVSGTVKDTQQDGTTPSIDGQLDASMTRSAESGTLSSENNGLLKLVFVDNTMYMYGNSAFWASNVGGSSAGEPGTAGDGGPSDPELTAKLANHWLSLPADGASATGTGSSTGETSASSNPGGFGNLHDLSDELRHPTKDDSPMLDPVTSAAIDGHQTYVLSQQDGSKLYVDQHTLLPVHMNNSAKSPGGESSVHFDRYNAAVTIVAPTGATDMTTLLAGLFKAEAGLAN